MLAAACAMVQTPSIANAYEMSALDLIVDRQRGSRDTVATLAMTIPVMATTPMHHRTRTFDIARTGAPAIQTRTGAPDIFGSIALPIRRTTLDARWRHAADVPLVRHGRGWTRMLDRQRSVPVAVQLAMVNAWVNAHVTFTADRPGPGKGDRWATAGETLTRGRGDCEDFAIAKLQLLRLLGFDRNDLFLVIAHDLVRRQDHAVLVVRTDGMLVMLDSATDRLLDARNTSDYRPIMTFAGTRAWTHGYRTAPTTRFAALAARPSVDPL